MVARIGRVDRDDRQMPQVLAIVAEWLRRDPRRFLKRCGWEHVGNAELVDRDQREAARRERVAQHLRYADGDAWRSSGAFRQHQVAGPRVARGGPRGRAPVLVVYPREP